MFGGILRRLFGEAAGEVAQNATARAAKSTLGGVAGDIISSKAPKMAKTTTKNVANKGIDNWIQANFSQASPSVRKIGIEKGYFKDLADRGVKSVPQLQQLADAGLVTNRARANFLKNVGKEIDIDFDDYDDIIKGVLDSDIAAYSKTNKSLAEVTDNIRSKINDRARANLQKDVSATPWIEDSDMMLNEILGGTADLTAINKRISEMVSTGRTEKQIRDELTDKVYNEMMGNNGGVSFINTVHDPNVSYGQGVTKRVSDNHGLYREYFKEHGYAPTKKAIGEMVDEYLEGKPTMLTRNISPELLGRDTVTEVLGLRRAQEALDNPEFLQGYRNLKPTEVQSVAKQLRDQAAKLDRSIAPSAADTSTIKFNRQLADALEDKLDNTLGLQGLTGAKLRDYVMSDLTDSGVDPAIIRRVSEIPAEKMSMAELRKVMGENVWASDLLGDIQAKGGKAQATLPLGLEKIPGVGPLLAEASGSLNKNIKSKVAEGMMRVGDPAVKSTASAIKKWGKRAGLVGAGILFLQQFTGKEPASNDPNNIFNVVASSGNTGNVGKMGGLGAGQMAGETGGANALTLNGYTTQDLESAYVAAMLAGDAPAADLIKDMLGVLSEKIKVAKADAKESGSSGGGNAKVTAALNSLSVLSRLFQQAGGGQGLVKGGLASLFAPAGIGSTNAEVKAYNDMRQAATAQIVKALGDTGALSDSDIKRAAAMIPDITDTQEQAELKMASLYQILLGAQ